MSREDVYIKMYIIRKRALMRQGFMSPLGFLPTSSQYQEPFYFVNFSGTISFISQTIYGLIGCAIWYRECKYFNISSSNKMFFEATSWKEKFSMKVWEFSILLPAQLPSGLCNRSNCSCDLFSHLMALHTEFNTFIRY